MHLCTNIGDVQVLQAQVSIENDNIWDTYTSKCIDSKVLLAIWISSQIWKEKNNMLLPNYLVFNICI